MPITLTIFFDMSLHKFVSHDTNTFRHAFPLQALLLEAKQYWNLCLHLIGFTYICADILLRSKNVNITCTSQEQHYFSSYACCISNWEGCVFTQSDLMMCRILNLLFLSYHCTMFWRKILLRMVEQHGVEADYSVYFARSWG